MKSPDTSLIIFAIVVAAAVLTWVVPPGAYDRTTIEVEGVGTREVVVPGTFERLPPVDRSTTAALVHTIGMVFQAPILGFVDPEAAPIIAFVLLIGGAFAVLQRTTAVDAALQKLFGIHTGDAGIDAAMIADAQEAEPEILPFIHST